MESHRHIIPSEVFALNNQQNWMPVLQALSQGSLHSEDLNLSQIQTILLHRPYLLQDVLAAYPDQKNLILAVFVDLPIDFD